MPVPEAGAVAGVVATATGGATGGNATAAGGTTRAGAGAALAVTHAGELVAPFGGESVKVAVR